MTVYNYDEDAIIYIEDQIYTFIENEGDKLHYKETENGFSIHIDFGKFFDGFINAKIDKSKGTIEIIISSLGIHRVITKPLEKGVQYLGGGVLGLGGGILGALFGGGIGAVGGGVGGGAIGAAPGAALNLIDDKITNKLNEKHIKTLRYLFTIFDKCLCQREDIGSFEKYVGNYLDNNRLNKCEGNIVFKNGIDKKMYFNSYEKKKKEYIFYNTSDQSDKPIKVKNKDMVLINIIETDEYEKLYKDLKEQYRQAIKDANERIKPIDSELIKQARERVLKRKNSQK